MKTLYFDCFSGASGDMINGALHDIGLDQDAWNAAMATLDLTGYKITVAPVVKKGISAQQFNVEIDPDVKQPHRHLHHVATIIEGMILPAPVKEAAHLTFRQIAEAEAKVHGTTIEKVHFHEVGAVDSIVDVVGAHLALHILGIERIYVSPLHVGAGTIACAHGVLPVPAPATALLLEGAPCYGGEVMTELVTPTGAALLTQLAHSFGPMPMMTINRVGYGAGTRDLGDRANVLRVMLGEMADTLPATESIMVIETNIDDMNPEILAAVIPLIIENGAREAFLTPVIGKKGRPGQLLTVLCDIEKTAPLCSLLLRHTSTFGLRMRREERLCMARAWRKARTPWGEVRVKCGEWQGDTVQQAPEYEDCAAMARMAGVPVREVYAAAIAAAAQGNLTDA